jgi:hypothetical protein
LGASGYGCASPQLYTTAFSHRGRPEVGLAFEPIAAAAHQNPREPALVTLGDVQIRVRLALGDHCDLGVLVGVPRLGMDFKCALLQTRHHALALDVGGSATLFGSGWGNVPLLYTYRAEESSVTFIAGVSAYTEGRGFYNLVSDGRNRDLNVTYLDTGGAYVRGGIGFALGGTPRVHPEINVYHQVRGDRVTFVTFGLGFLFGRASRVVDPFPPQESVFQPPPQ